MRPAFSHPALLGGAVVLWVRSGVIVMEAHAPAAAKDAVVALHQRGERGPRRLIESLHGVCGFGHGSSLTRGHGMSFWPPPEVVPADCGVNRSDVSLRERCSGRI